MKLVAALSILALLVAAPPAVSQAPDDRLIVPGQRIGRWTLEMTIEDLTRELGPPTRTFLTFAGSPPDVAAIRDFVVHLWDRAVIVAVSPDRKRIEVLFAGHPDKPLPNNRTDKAIGFDATRQVVEAAYGPPTAVTEAHPNVLFWLIYDAIGLVFRVDKRGGMVQIGVFRPGAARATWKFR